jgi:hypothetical protein
MMNKQNNAKRLILFTVFVCLSFACDPAMNGDSQPTAVKINPADLAAVNQDIRDLEITFAPGDSSEDVKNNLLLPAAGDQGSTISWKSSKPRYLTSGGIVERDDFLKVRIELTAAAKKGNAVKTDIFILSVTPKNAIDYYVSATGSDSQAGTISDPLASLTQALDLAVAAGGNKTIALSAGVYNLNPNIYYISTPGIRIYGGFNSDFTDRNILNRDLLLFKTEIRSGGTTTLFQFVNAANCLLEGLVFKSDSIYDFVSVSGSSGFIFKNNTVIRTGSSSAGNYVRALIASQCDNIQVKQNIIDFSQLNCQGGMNGLEMFQSKKITVENNRITFGSSSGNSLGLIRGMVIQGGDTISNSVNLIRYNTIDLGVVTGSQKFGYGAEVASYRNNSSTYFTHNRIIARDQVNATVLNGFSSYQITDGYFYHNLIELGKGTAQEVYGMELNEDSNWKMDHNSIAVQTKGSWVYGVRLFDDAPLIRNNIISLLDSTSSVRHGLHPDTADIPVENHNCVFVAGGESPGSKIPDSTDIVNINPRLNLMSELRLTSGTPSQIRQSGLNLYETHDYLRLDRDQTPRPQAGYWSMGAYQ